MGGRGRGRLRVARTRDGIADNDVGSPRRPSACTPGPPAISTAPVALLEELSGVRWDATGQPVLREEGSPVRDAPIALADILLASGQEQKGRRLLAAIIARMRQEMGTPGHPEIWYYSWHPVALALNGERDAAIEMLQAPVREQVRIGLPCGELETEPSFAELRKDARFQALMRQMRSRLDEQRRELDRLRAEGVVPDRSGKPGAPAETARLRRSRLVRLPRLVRR